jgi:hypothetical protein
MLEPCDAKVSSTVLRGLGDRKVAWLLGNLADRTSTIGDRLFFSDTRQFIESPAVPTPLLRPGGRASQYPCFQRLSAPGH